ncbi:MAG: ornithine--oxo-acid transaminase [Fimbriimonadaceae bacterium]
MAVASKTLWQRISEDGATKVASELSDSESIEITEKYGAHNYHPLPVNIVSARGAYAIDGSGKEYIDCVGAYSALAHGHLGESIVQTIQQQLEKVSLTSRAFYTSEMALFLKGLAEFAEMDMVCPMNTGAEAVETCIKLARKWGYTKKGVPDGKAEIIVCEGNFHGRTTTIVGFSSEPTYKQHFGPFTPGFVTVPFGDAEALERAVTPNTVGFLSEPIQAEAGILMPPDGYLERVREITNRENVLLIWDEVQTGFCRTGRKFAWMFEDSKPDLMAVGKPLGGGIMPVSAAIGSREVMSVFEPGDHGSTFGGNSLSSVVALAALADMEVDRFCERASSLGTVMMSMFDSLPKSHVHEVRGRGLLIGLEVTHQVDTEKLTERFLANGLLTKETRHRTFRFAPPLTVDDRLIADIVDRVRVSLEEAG